MRKINMRSLFILVSALCISVNVLAFKQENKQEKIKASGNYTTRTIHVSDFDAIELIGSRDVYYEQTTNGTHSVEVYGSDNLVDLIKANVSGKTLEISMEKNVQIDFGKAGKLHVKVSSPEIKSASLQGAGNIFLNSKIQTPELSLMLQGAGDITANYPLSVTNVLNVNLQGAGDISLKNDVQAGSCHITLERAGDIKATRITANNGKIHLEGSGDIEIKNSCAIKDVEISMIGAGDVKIYGIDSQKVSSSLKGSGDIVLKGNTKEAILSLQNSGDLKADNLKAQNVNAYLKGSGRLKCYATDNLKAEISGSGDIRYKGKPRVEAKGKKENIKPL